MGEHAHDSPALRAAYARSLAPYLNAISELAREAVARGLAGQGARPRVGAVGRASEALAKVIRDTQMAADLAGRSDALKAARQMVGGRSLGPPRKPPGKPPGAFPDPFGAGAGGLPRVPFTEAVADILAREPMLVSGAAEVARAYNEQHAFAMAHAVEAETVTRVQKALAKAMHEGTGARDMARNVRTIARRVGEDMAEWTMAYSETVAETNIATAYSAGRMRQMADPAVASVIGALMFDGPDDSSARPNHVAAIGLIAAPTDPVWDILAPPLGFRSFLPDVRMAGIVDAASKTKYSGPVVRLLTREGGWLTVTPNHPVLEASRGFIPAGGVREGDYLVRHLPSDERLPHGPGNRTLASVGELRRAIHDEQMPARVEDLFHAALGDGTGPTVQGFARPLPLDFHGDAACYDGEVHVVSLDRLLPDDCRPSEALTQESDKRRFVLPESPGLLAYSASLTMERVGSPCLLGRVPSIDTNGAKPIVDAGSRGAYLLRQLKDRYPGEVAFTEVQRVDVRPYSGHVYDLQSPLGWIVANGLVTSNCRHGLSFVDWLTLKRKGLLLPDGTVRPAQIPPGAFPDPGFRHTGRPDRSIYGHA